MTLKYFLTFFSTLSKKAKIERLRAFGGVICTIKSKYMRKSAIVSTICATSGLLPHQENKPR